MPGFQHSIFYLDALEHLLFSSIQIETPKQLSGLLEDSQRQHSLIDNGLSALLLTHHSSLSRLSVPFLSLHEHYAVGGLPSPLPADALLLLKLGERGKKCSCSRGAM